MDGCGRAEEPSPVSAPAADWEARFADLYLAEDGWKRFREEAALFVCTEAAPTLASSLSGSVRMMRRYRLYLLKSIVFIVSIRTTYRQLPRKAPSPESRINCEKCKMPG